MQELATKIVEQRMPYLLFFLSATCLILGFFEITSISPFNFVRKTYIPLIIVASVLLLIAIILWFVDREPPKDPTSQDVKIFDREQDTYHYMCDVINDIGPAIFSVDMSYAGLEHVQIALRRKAEQHDLTLFLPRMIDFAEELKNLGAKVYIYGDNRFTPKSRFTIVRSGRADAHIYCGYHKGNKFVIRTFR